MLVQTFSRTDLDRFIRERGIEARGLAGLSDVLCMWLKKSVLPPDIAAALALVTMPNGPEIEAAISIAGIKVGKVVLR